MRFYTIFFIFLFFGSGLYFPVSSAAQQQNSILSEPKNLFLVEEQIRYNRNKIMIVNDELERLYRVKKQIEQIEIFNNNVLLDKQKLSKMYKEIEEIKNKYKKFEKDKYRAMISKQEIIKDIFLRNFIEPGRTLSIKLREILSLYQKGSMEYISVQQAINFANNQEIKLIRALSEKYPAVKIIFRLGDNTMSMPEKYNNIFGFDVRYFKDHQSFYNDIDKLMNEDRDSLSKILEMLKNINKKYKINLLKYINTSIKNRNDKVKILEKNMIHQSSLLEKQLDKKSEIDEKLIYAVYGMIFVLFMSILSLKLLDPDVAKELISKRTIVEVVGVSFMLITIIILSTGDKLSKEILGTLLGTIAGYIFSRGIHGLSGNEK